MPSFAVAIVNYNTREHLAACLATVQVEVPIEVVVVDNASSDGSAEMVRTRYPWVTLYANKTNPGYGAAANQAIASCTAEYVLLLNSDTRVHAGALRALSTYLDRYPRAAIVGPRIVNPDGTLQASCYPFLSPLNTLLVETSLGNLVCRVPILRNYYLRAWAHTDPRVVPWVLGAALAIRREAFEAVSGFDEAFFMYYEEADLCYRLGAIDWQIHFAPVATIVHVGGASTTRYRTAMAVQHFASAMQFYQRHYSGRRLAELVMIWKAIMLTRWILDTTRLYLTQDVCKRATIAADVAAWQQILLGHWRKRVAHG